MFREHLELPMEVNGQANFIFIPPTPNFLSSSLVQLKDKHQIRIIGATTFQIYFGDHSPQFVVGYAGSLEIWGAMLIFPGCISAILPSSRHGEEAILFH